MIKGARVEDLPERISDLLNKLKETEKELAGVRSAAALNKVGELINQASDVHGIKVISAPLPDGISGDDLRKIATEIRGKLPDSVVTLTSISDGKVVLVSAVSDGARAQGVKAGSLVKLASTVLGGGGGGKDDFAQGGGVDPTKIPQALEAVKSAIAAR